MTYTKENAQKYGRMGGSKTSISKKISKRKYCTSSCPLFDKCPLMPLAMNEWVETPKGKKHPCLLNSLPPETQRRIRRLFLSGREGLIQELKDVLFKLSQSLENSPEKNLSRYADLILKAITTVYGAKVQEEGKMDVNINIHVVGEDGEQ